MTKQDSSSSSARVKAFRDRLGSQFKRVEAYVTEDEKSRIQAIKTAENVTVDVAVAGLLRLGLERYEELKTQSNFAASLSEKFVEGTTNASLSCRTNASLSCLETVANLDSCALSALNAHAITKSTVLGSLSISQTPDVTDFVVAPASSAAESPVARFFRKRKEIVNE